MKKKKLKIIEVENGFVITKTYINDRGMDEHNAQYVVNSLQELNTFITDTYRK